MAVWKNDYIKINEHSRPGLKLTNHAKGIAHYTANPGATAANHWNYFNNLNDRYASAHIFVDKHEAICIIPLDEVAYAANDGTYRGVPALKPNANYKSISVEMCQEPDGSFHPDTIDRTEDVFVELSKMYGWDPLKDIVRHYDVTHKNCPAPWVSNPKAFTDFKNRVNDKLCGKKVSKPKETQTGSTQITNTPKSSKWTDKSGNWTGGVLKQGHSGSQVKQLQELLASNNYYPDKGAKNNGVDGYYGAKTEDAVRRYQSMHGLSVDGIAGKATYNSLKGSKSKPKSSGLPNATYKAVKPYPSGDGVRAVQNALAAKYYYPDKGAKNNGIDGVYGPKTADAVKRYQSMHGLTADGIYGPSTRKSLQG